MVLYLTADLVWESRIRGTAREVGTDCRRVRSHDVVQDLLGANPGGSPVLLLVDLEADGALDLIARGSEGRDAKGVEGRIRIVAFGPHVQTERLREAEAAGADRVLSKARLAEQLPALIREAAGQNDPGGNP